MKTHNSYLKANSAINRNPPRSSIDIHVEKKNPAHDHSEQTRICQKPAKFRAELASIHSERRAAEGNNFISPCGYEWLGLGAAMRAAS